MRARGWNPRRRPAPPPGGWLSAAEATAAALAATTWEQWQAAAAAQSRYSPVVLPLPRALAWQHNPSAPPPPGHTWARCLCFVTLVRPPSWHGQVRTVEGHLRYGVDPAVTVGSVCQRYLGPDGAWHGCGAPLRAVRRRDDPYPWGFWLVDPGPLRAAPGQHNGGEPSPAVVPALRPAVRAVDPTLPAPADNGRRQARLDAARPLVVAGNGWPRFGSMAAERAWVAAQRRAGQVSS